MVCSLVSVRHSFDIFSYVQMKSNMEFTDEKLKRDRERMKREKKKKTLAFGNNDNNGASNDNNNANNNSNWWCELLRLSYNISLCHKTSS